MKHDDSDRLQYAAESLEYVLEWTSAGRDSFLTDRTMRDAVLRRLQTMAQALRDLSATRRSRYPEVPFRAIAGFRNVLVHDYISIDPVIVWDIVETHLPPLRPQVARMLAEL